MKQNSPIGIFDSGLGGLSVLTEIKELLPHEDLIYIADSAHIPYGSKSADFIRERSHLLTSFLQQQGAKAIVVACNTATAAAVPQLRSDFPTLPIIGMEPALKPAASATRTGTVGVLATEGTLTSKRFKALLERYAVAIEVIIQPCPGLVEQVERNDLNSPVTHALLTQYIEPLLARNVDTIILGCTHYPFLQAIIADIVGPQVKLIHTGRAVARQLQRVLSNRQMLSMRQTPGQEQFWTSSSATKLEPAINKLLKRSVTLQPLPRQRLPVLSE